MVSADSVEFAFPRSESRQPFLSAAPVRVTDSRPLRLLLGRRRRGDGGHLQGDDLPPPAAPREHIRDPVLPAGVLPAVLALQRRQAGHHRGVAVDPHRPVARFERVEPGGAGLDVGQALRLREHGPAGGDEGQIVGPDAFECGRVLALQGRDILVGQLSQLLLGVAAHGDLLAGGLTSGGLRLGFFRRLGVLLGLLLGGLRLLLLPLLALALGLLGVLGRGLRRARRRGRLLRGGGSYAQTHRGQDKKSSHGRFLSLAGLIRSLYSEAAPWQNSPSSNVREPYVFYGRRTLLGVSYQFLCYIIGARHRELLKARYPLAAEAFCAAPLLERERAVRLVSIRSLICQRIDRPCR